MNDNNVIALPGVNPQAIDGTAPDPAIIDMLEKLLADTKRGEVVWMGIAYLDHERAAHSLWEGGGDTYQYPSGPLLTSALGAISFLDKRFGESLLDGSASAEH